jgi:dihydroorotase
MERMVSENIKVFTQQAYEILQLLPPTFCKPMSKHRQHHKLTVVISNSNPKSVFV